MHTELNEEVKSIKVQAIRLLVNDVLASVHEDFWVKPASSTGKYHPASSLGEGGLIRHTQLVYKFAVHISTPKCANITPLGMDLMRAAAILHDSMKYGASGGSHTTEQHPQLAATLIDSTYRKNAPKYEAAFNIQMPPGSDTFEHAVEILCRLVLTHMGEWGAEQPKSSMERLFHLADYLASRKDINQ